MLFQTTIKKKFLQDKVKNLFLRFLKLKGKKMKEKKFIYLFILLSCFSLQLISSVSLGDFQSNFNIATNLKYKIESLINGAQGGDPGEGDIFGDRTIGLLEKSISKADNISSTLNIINDNMVKKFENLQELIINLDETQTKSALMRRFADSVDRIHAVYDELLDLSDEEKKITEKRIERFVDDNINSKDVNSIEGQLQKLQSTIVSDSNSENLLQVMERIEKVSTKIMFVFFFFSFIFEIIHN